MNVEHNRTIWEKLGAAEGLWATAFLGAQFFIMLGTRADPAAGDAAFSAALMAERMQWEWMTLLRIVGGLCIVWWMGSLAGRLRLVEGEPGRLATIAFGVGVIWGALWLVSALFNSAAILFAADYANPAGSRFAGALAIETMYVLTPATMVVLTLAVGFVAVRFGGFPRWYAWTTLATCGSFFVLAIIDWAGSGSLSLAMMAVALAWMALTSALLIPTYRAEDLVAGTKRRVTS